VHIKSAFTLVAGCSEGRVGDSLAAFFHSIEVLLKQGDHVLWELWLCTPCTWLARLNSIDKGESVQREGGGIFGGADNALDG
jgi:hypothetical protein